MATGMEPPAVDQPVVENKNNSINNNNHNSNERHPQRKKDSKNGSKGAWSQVVRGPQAEADGSLKPLHAKDWSNPELSEKENADVLSDKGKQGEDLSSSKSYDQGSIVGEEASLKLAKTSWKKPSDGLSEVTQQGGVVVT